MKEGQLRCGEHSDYGSITLVFQNLMEGLQVKNILQQTSVSESEWYILLGPENNCAAPFSVIIVIIVVVAVNIFLLLLV